MPLSTVILNTNSYFSYDRDQEQQQDPDRQEKGSTNSHAAAYPGRNRQVTPIAKK